MRLSRIKLAGFKSFVDPTTFQLPSNLVGIVGPNGCGKSNVIDAVRWVMGEMSAKHLRGDSMADVIFNGSASRKPVGIANIELFFDNSDGAIGGPYAQYSEISLKRTLARDGTSSYFLNNTRCRRKDITDLFLGTGLGSRSYAIIEQGMVSRLVEAKPDEMRIYVEEAAGISKYKERRRETETRIQHTKDNLARLSDLREEISKQIEYLQRQARTAERYKEHKARERKLEAELLAIRLADIDRHLDEDRREHSRGQTQLEAAIASQRRIETDIVKARERHVAATEGFNKVQARHYGVQSEISRLEQAIAHAREIRDRQHSDLVHTREQATLLESEISRDMSQLEALQAALLELEPALVQTRLAETAAIQALRQAEEALERWQQAWQEFNLAEKEIQQTAQVEQTRIEHLVAQLGQLRRQLETLEHEREGVRCDDSDDRLKLQTTIELDTQSRAAALQARLDALEAEADGLRQDERRLGADLERMTAELASGRGQLGALEAMQQAALGGDDAELSQWLSREKLQHEPRVAQKLRVEDRWLLAVETVLGEFLQAVCVKGFAHHLSSLPDTQLVLVERSMAESVTDPRTLVSHVAEPGELAQLLANVFTAENLPAAVLLQRDLQPHQSVITPDGIWLGPGWVRVNRGQRTSVGALSREHQMRHLRSVIAEQEQEIGRIESDREAARSRLAQLAEDRNQVTQEFNAANRDHAEALAVLEGVRQQSTRARERGDLLDRNIGDIVAEVERLDTTLSDARDRAERASRECRRLFESKPELERQQDELVAACNLARDVAEQERAAVARTTIEFEGRRVTRESADAGLARLQAQLQQLSDRSSQLELEISGSQPAIASMQSELASQLEQQLQVDRALAESRAELEQVESALRAYEGERSAAEKAVGSSRESVDSIRLRVRELEIRREAVMESFAANGASPDTVFNEMPPDADARRWQESLEEVRRKIERLGPINLAAIEQYNEQAERKQYLDAQNDDLTAALETLEQAIRKIERETRSRFQETFDNINQGLKRIFPRLFGGGHAYLSLEGEDILSAGVTVMARPPGKRNSHIHLLSGGEKALTAVALIFSIFELNPAPFCLLDEVDAPLDEANVGRFCDIVREMSQRVQFVVITHNKTTMEMVKQLTGVTMNEPGVSRLVSVDLDAAVQLAAS